MRNLGQTKLCLFCDTSFSQRLDRKNDFCSITCANKSRRKYFPRPCGGCGKSFQPPSNHPKQKCCTTECRDLVRRTRRHVPCVVCGRMVERQAQRLQILKHSFCTRTCWSAWLLIHVPRGKKHPQYKERTLVTCDWCGAEFARLVSRMHQRNLCGVPCRTAWQRESGYITQEKSPTWRGGHNDYRGPDWDRQKKLAMKRDKGICQKCGVKAVEVHHLRPYQLFENSTEANKLENLQSLCKQCHTKTEWEYRKTHSGEKKYWEQKIRIHTCRKCNKPYQTRHDRSLDCDNCTTDWRRRQKAPKLTPSALGTDVPGLSVLETNLS